MKLFNSILLAPLASLGLIVTSANAVVIDFESFDAGDVISGSGVFSDVEFNSDLRVLQVFEANPGPEFSGNKAAGGDPFPGEPFEATFSIENVNLVSVVMGDFGSDSEVLFLRAYDSSDSLLDEDTANLGFISGGIALSVFNANGLISYVQFGSVGPFANSVYFDDFTYGLSGTEPPPPPPTRVPDTGATLALLVMGMGLLGAARRFSR